MTATVVTYIGYGGNGASPSAGSTKIYFPVEYIGLQWVDEEGGNVEVIPAKTSLNALFGIEASGPRNIAVPKGKYKLVLAIRGVLHDLLAAEYGGGSDIDGYTVKNNVMTFLATQQHLASSTPIRFLYPHWYGVGSHQEFEGVVDKFMIEDEAGVGSGLDFPSWDYNAQFEVAKVVLPF